MDDGLLLWLGDWRWWWCGRRRGSRRIWKIRVWARADEETGARQIAKRTLTGVGEKVDGGQQRRVIARWDRKEIRGG